MPSQHQFDRRSALKFAFSAGAFGALVGCDPRQAMFFLQPFDQKIPAPCPSLKGKRVVVLTTSSAGGDGIGIEQEITRGLCTALTKEIKKIDVVEPSQVRAWSQAKPTWTDPAEAARAFDADVAIYLEIRNFEMQNPNSPGLFEGHSDTHIRVVELAHPKDSKGKPIPEREKEANIIYEGDRSTNYPVTGHIPIEAGVNATAFKNKFVGIVIQELSWHFVDHAPGDNIQNTRFD